MFNLFKKLTKPTVTVESEASARLAAVESVLAANPDQPAALREKGEALFLLSRYCGKPRYDEALACFERLSAIDPLDMHARYYRGLIHALSKRPQETERLARELAEMTPRNGDEWYARAFAHLFLQQRDEAEAALRKVLAEIPTHTHAINDMAGLKESPAEAIALIDTGLKARPNNPELLYNKACNFLWLENPKACVQVLDTLLEAAPLDPEGWILKGEALQALGKGRDAAAALQRGLELDKTSVKGWNLAGQVLCDMGETERALSCFERATDLDPENANLWFDKGKAHGMMQDYAKSTACFERALQIDPGHQDAKDLLDACRRAGV